MLVYSNSPTKWIKKVDVTIVLAAWLPGCLDGAMMRCAAKREKGKDSMAAAGGRHSDPRPEAKEKMTKLGLVKSAVMVEKVA